MNAEPVFLKHFNLRQNAETARDILRQNGIVSLLQSRYGADVGHVEGATDMFVMPEDHAKAAEIMSVYGDEIRHGDVEG